MEENERQALLESQSRELYEAIGKCAVKFEHVSHMMHEGITMLLGKGGLQNQHLARVMLAELTAYPLQSILRAMIAELGSLSSDDKAICDKIFIRVKKLIERRNDIIHNTWFVGWADAGATDVSVVSGHKWVRRKEGAVIRGEKRTSADFEDFAAECDRVAALVNRLWVCVFGDYGLKANFVFDDNGDIACSSR